ncbi:PrsW family glutamic-type intramembrane protease [Leptolyngbya sp. FACHB-711]|uniref:PrsW family intramembrane metalloprotease n=1 Tax=unclassified Leptolyngbya TaxID=2650499 RepID=UPI0016828245|nr:PrsW family glutamic-type intramembrane protease [Leptolyngbya sp. FACHB-711]MBD1849062.1 PrsW family intramembrane metalloprotease [Cyanobacteria bacterium FACHB-502]MBD2024753.1 PrsW family intramembrane metalloprotease [Leptolyngbya sp. FACHB-711]
MTQPDLRALAQQGNPQAIALWLNQTLQPRGVTAKVLTRASLLKILLIADRPLEQQAFVELVKQQIRELDLPHLQQIKVYCQLAGNDRPTWIAEFSPIPSESQSRALVPVSASVEEPRLPPKNLSFTVLFPYREVLRPERYQSAIVRLLLFLGLVPLMINLLAKQVSLAQTAWLTAIYYAIVWGLVFYHLIKPSRVSWGYAIGCVLFTVFISIPGLLLVQRIPPFSLLYGVTEQGLPGRLIGFVLGVGILEEACKAIPLLLPLLHARRLPEPPTIAFYGAMSGLGFAVAESGAYAVQYAIGLTRGQIDLGMYLATHSIRFGSLPLFHAVLTGIVGYFIGLSARYPSRRAALLLLGLTIAAVLHGLYNAVSGGLPGLGVVGFSILLFVAYLDRSSQIMQYLEQIEQARSQRHSL